MGVCLSAQTKAETRFNSGLSSKRVSGDTEEFSSSRSKASSDLSSTSSEVSLSAGSIPLTPPSVGEILQSSNLISFTSTELNSATRNFRADNVLGEGGFGSVFKGWIDEHSPAAAKPGTGIAVAVKRLINQNGFQDHKEWLADVNYLGQLSDPHLVKLIGYCLDDENRFLVYEFMPRGNLENHLFRRGSYFQPLSWSLRLKVALGAAKGLAFLHNADSKVIYRDFKTSNVLLDSVIVSAVATRRRWLSLEFQTIFFEVLVHFETPIKNYNAKFFDFGLAKDGPTGDKSHVFTYGYAAPECLATGQHTTKSDVFSFGVVLLEILSGRRAIDKNRPLRQHNLVEWAKPYLANRRKILRVLDNRLEGQYELEEAYKVATLSLRCLSTEAKLRPNMDEVVTHLEQLQVPHLNESNQNRLRRNSADDVTRVKTAAAYPHPSASLLCT